MCDGPAWREHIRTWLESGGQQSFVARMDAMSSAFGLRDITFLKELYLNPMEHGMGMGHYLLRDVYRWVVEHPDLGHNNTEYEKTIFSNMNLG